jgi:hypothetical protein
MARSHFVLLLAPALVIAGATAAACGSGDPLSTFPDASTDTGAKDGASDQMNPDLPEVSTTWSDFPPTPIVGMGLPAGIAQEFAKPSTPGDAPCVFEPSPDAMIPKNWSPLFVEWSAPAAQNVFEIQLTVDNQKNALRVYTSASPWTMDATMWTALGTHSAGHDIEYVIRGAKLENGTITGGPWDTAKGKWHIAPVDAPGSIIYWASSGGTVFKGFTVGDTKPKKVLTPGTAGTTSTGGTTVCISCHTSSPDGKLLFYSRDGNDNSRATDVRTVVDAGAAPPGDVSPAALALLGRTKQTAAVLSAAHYAANDAVAISVYSSPQLNGGRYELIWTDLHATNASGWGVLARNGDPRNVSSPSWRHDGTAIAYTSSAGGGEGVVADVTAQDPTMDIYTVPYGNKAGGNATPLPGASDPNAREFYPVYSPGDVLLAFNKSLQPVSSYDQPSAELYVVPGGGGTATRLRANDPPVCTNLGSPGLTNSWPRWAPKAGTAGSEKFYWVVFSSKRRVASMMKPQLYIAAVVTTVGGGGQETFARDYPAVYVLAQDPTDNNHTPAWDNFEVSQIPPN